jgi:hypothetical protein
MFTTSRMMLITTFGLALATQHGCGLFVGVEDDRPPPRRMVVEEPQANDGSSYEEYEEHRGPTVVQYEPPAPRREVIVYAERPSPAHFWIHGHWDWDGGRWGWNDGRWARSPHGVRSNWHDGRWERRGNQWHWNAGFWLGS